MIFDKYIHTVSRLFPTSPRQRLAGVVLVCLISLFSGLDRRIVGRQQELRVVLSARQMVESGNWLVPYYMGHPRFQKPPLMYWAVASVYRAGADVTSAGWSRLPVCLFGVLLLGTLYLFGRVMQDHLTGLLASGLCFSTLLFQEYTRLSETDVPLAFFSTLSMLAVYLALTGENPKRWWWVAGVSCGLGILMKGPAGIVLPMLVVAGYVISTPSSRRRVKSWTPASAFLLALGIGLSWYLALWLIPEVRELMQATVDHELDALVQKGGHPGAWYYYFIRLPALLVPWGLLLPAIPFSVNRSRLREPGFRFVVIWFLVTFSVLTLLHNKQEHYLLLMLAPSSLVMALAFKRVLSGVANRSKRWICGFTFFVLGLIVLAGVVCLVGAPFVSTVSTMGGVILGLVLLGLGGLGLRAARSDTWLPAWGCCLVAMAVLMQGWLFLIIPQSESRQILRTCAREVKATTLSTPESQVLVTGSGVAVVEFYLGRRIQHMPDLASAWQNAGPGDVVIGTAKLKKATLETKVIPLAPDAEFHDRYYHCAVFRK